MTTRRWAQLVATNVRRARRQFLLSAFGIAVGIASLAFFGALSTGVRAVLLGQVFRADRIEIEPAKSSYQGGLAGLLAAGPKPLTDETVAELRAVRGVRAVAPRMRLAFPAKGWGGERIFGNARFIEVIGDGVDPSVVAGDDLGPLPFADLEDPNAPQCTSDADCAGAPGTYCAWDINRCQKPIPIVVSKFLVELVRTTLGKQELQKRMFDMLLGRLKGFTFTVELGKSFIGPPSARGVPRQRKVMLVGVSDRAVPVGVSFPISYVRRWNAEYAGEEAARGYTSITVEVSDKAAITRVAERARALGYQVVDSGAEQAGLAVTLITMLLFLASLAIIAVAAINIAHSFFRTVAERRREIGILRAVGASRADVQRIILGEAAAVGFVGGAAGLCFAYALGRLLDFASHAQIGGRLLVPDFPFKPASFFEFPWWLSLGVVGFAVVACLAGAWLPARAAARLEPAEALSGP